MQLSAKMIMEKLVACNLLGARRPGELLATYDVDVEVEDGLAAMPAIVDYQPVPVLQSLLRSNLLARKHQLAQNLQSWRRNTSCQYWASILLSHGIETRICKVNSGGKINNELINTTNEGTIQQCGDWRIFKMLL